MHRRLFASLCLCLHLGAQEPAPKPEPVAPAVPAVGQPAPGFRLNDDSGKAVAIGGKTANWTVLAFYPKAATPG